MNSKIKLDGLCAQILYLESTDFTRMTELKNSAHLASTNHECSVPHPVQEDIKLHNGIWQRVEPPNLVGVETFWLFSAFVHSAFPQTRIAKVTMVTHGTGNGKKN